MNVALPGPIADYFAAANEARIEDAAACFAVDALVHDEERDHQGRQEIRRWIDGTTRRYRPQTEILRAEARENVFTVTARVSGTFPGSPAELEFAFTVNDGKISRLTIG